MSLEIVHVCWVELPVISIDKNRKRVTHTPLLLQPKIGHTRVQRDRVQVQNQEDYYIDILQFHSRRSRNERGYRVVVLCCDCVFGTLTVN